LSWGKLKGGDACAEFVGLANLAASSVAIAAIEYLALEQPDWVKQAIGSDVGFEIGELTSGSHRE
jgi:hypothetical protein